ncbi:G2/mitotic-specific cyclin-2-like protein [Tanacetum coccineum]
MCEEGCNWGWFEEGVCRFTRWIAEVCLNGVDVIPHCQSYRPVPRTSAYCKKETSAGWSDSNAPCMQLYYEEIFVPVVEDFIVISDKAYTRDEVLMMLERLSFYLIDDMLKYQPSLLAAAAVFTAELYPQL